MSIYTLISNLLEREGGYVNHPNDRGGPTNMGITHTILAAWRNVDSVSAEEVENLTRAEAVSIYKALYWVKPGFNFLQTSPVVIELLFDMAVHHGPGTAVRMLQRAAGVKDDGIIGPITRGVVGRLSGPTLAAGLMAERLDFIGDILTARPKQYVFADGWLNRFAKLVLMIPEA